MPHAANTPAFDQQSPDGGDCTVRGRYARRENLQDHAAVDNSWAKIATGIAIRKLLALDA